MTRTSHSSHSSHSLFVSIRGLSHFKSFSIHIVTFIFATGRVGEARAFRATLQEPFPASHRKKNMYDHVIMFDFVCQGVKVSPKVEFKNQSFKHMETDGNQIC